jgi:hypothetical protein
MIIGLLWGNDWEANVAEVSMAWFKGNIYKKRP